jgi:aspartyl-tRNA(Asn)/glutamyl-tRNA(Gln) amidotransferase subunit A
MAAHDVLSSLSGLYTTGRSLLGSGMPIDDLLSGRLSGHALALAARALRQPRIAALGAEVVRRDFEIEALWTLLEGDEPIEPDVVPRQSRPPRPRGAQVELPEAPVWALTTRAIARAYREGRTTPEALLDQLLAAHDRLAQRQPLLACLWTRDESGARAAARAAGQRLRDGQPRGLLDGVPLLVKEQIAVKGLPRRLGHELPGPSPMAADAALVARLREAGALIVGQTAMTELGLSPLGINAKRPPLRNPHHLERVAGGSSTGSGVAVALGLTPIAVGADGGGSIRIPAALCGVYGLKPTYGRVPRSGDGFSGSVNHDGPIAASVHDLALFLDAAAGPDAGDPASLHAPERPSFVEAAQSSVRDLRVGIDPVEWRDAEPRVQRACEQALKALEAAGAVLVDVKMPLARTALSLGALTIVSETYASMIRSFEQHRDAYGLDVQVFMQVASQLSLKEYVWAQMLRERLRVQVARTLLEVDALALPTTASTAPSVSDADDRTGRLDTAGVKAMTRFTFLGNLTGLPAGSVPVGVDPEGLPIGLQIVGDAWDEGTVLALMAELERSGAARSPRCAHHLALLDD